MTDVAHGDRRKSGDGGAGVRFLTRDGHLADAASISSQRLKAELPNSKWIQYEPVNQDNAMAGAKLAFGSPVQTIYKFDKAERILSLDADIFSGFNVALHKDFASGRQLLRREKEINRLYVVETTMTLTGCESRPPSRRQTEPDA